jgi:hypothetical protein
LGEFLYFEINKPWPIYGSGGFPIWQVVLCLAFTIFLVIRSRSLGLRIAALAFAISQGMSLVKERAIIKVLGQELTSGMDHGCTPCRIGWSAD